MKYLVMKCEPLEDAFECDAYRSPITMTNDWKKWYEKNHPKYSFEVYEYKNNSFSRIKEYDAPMEEGMVLFWYDEATEDEDGFNVIRYLPHYDRDMPMPKDLYNRMMKGKEIENCLKNEGYASWVEGDTTYVYTEYYDNTICSPY